MKLIIGFEIVKKIQQKSTNLTEIYNRKNN